MSLTKTEKSLIIARLARGKSKLPWRAAEEAVAIDKLMVLLDQATPSQPR